MKHVHWQHPVFDLDLEKGHRRQGNDTKTTMEAGMTENTPPKAYKLIALALIAVVLTASQTVDAKRIRMNEKTQLRSHPHMPSPQR